ncbi:MAG: DMT family transporter [Rhizobiales bacterium]|nr:DMT family transporter [Hyphomicrobiales bacterium]
MIKRHERLGFILGFFGMCLFAGTLPATRLAVTGFDPIFLTVARAVLAGLAGLVVLLVVRRRVPPRSLWFEMSIAALCTVVGFPLFAALAMMTVPAAHGGVVLGILPLATAAAAAVFAHERPSLGFWLASAIGAAIVLTFMLRRNSGETFSAGDLFLLGTVASGALGYTFSGRLAAHMPGWEVISWQVVISLPPAALATYALWPNDIASVSLSSWAGLGYVGFVSQYTAFFVFNAALAIGGIARVGQVMLLQPFVIVALALPVNGEAINIETIAFAAAVVATVLIGQRMRVTRR